MIPAPWRIPTLPQLQALAVEIRDHELIRCIGPGSYGEVWLARNVMGTYRAVKIVYRAAFERTQSLCVEPETSTRSDFKDPQLLPRLFPRDQLFAFVPCDGFIQLAQIFQVFNALLQTSWPCRVAAAAGIGPTMLPVPVRCACDQDVTTAGKRQPRLSRRPAGNALVFA
jgi:hypothetical protein